MSEMKSLTLNGEKYDCFVDTTARALSVGSAIIGSASGENITLYDASNYNLLDLHVYGKTTQDGTPTPDAPVERVSVGDGGSITVNTTGKKDAESMTIATPNGLPGIPVSSGGNYTDANGQQWVCDEIDFARGVYVQRIQRLTLTGNDPWGEYVYSGQHNGFNVSNILDTTRIRSDGLCNQFAVRNEGDNCVWIGVGNTTLYVISREWVDRGLEAWRSHLNVNPLLVIYPSATIVETPLSEEELAAYADLRTYRNQATISNDAGAHMEIEYVMDAKKYIDNLVISGGGSVARLTSVTLFASSWTGSNGLYSQVVSIPGITEYSKVDLLPSVEQLAIFHNKDVAFVTENEDGVVTVYAIGDKPLMDYTMQAQITEVLV